MSYKLQFIKPVISLDFWDKFDKRNDVLIRCVSSTKLLDSSKYEYECNKDDIRVCTYADLNLFDTIIDIYEEIGVSIIKLSGSEDEIVTTSRLYLSLPFIEIDELTSDGKIIQTTINTSRIEKITKKTTERSLLKGV